ncbi:tyrosine-type recombinase/integrase, partial [Alphaproteobacteria bacterium]|nr:tyrosine-type recombinase/integrase [Alphaproteobacteria bacterium]
MAKEIIINLDDDANVTKLKQSARSKSTRTKYLGDWKKFVAYTEEFLNYNPESKDINLSKENAENSIVRYVSWLKEDKKAKDLKGKSEITNRKHMKLNTGNSPPTNYKLSTLNRKIAAIKYYFKTHRGITINTKNQSLVEILDGIGQEYKDKEETKTKQAYEIVKEDLKQIIDSIPDDENLTNIRDKAMILLGWWSVCRRSEVLNLTIQDITFFDDYFEIHIRYSKTDQFGTGEKKLLPFNNDKYCPYLALKKW